MLEPTTYGPTYPVPPQPIPAMGSQVRVHYCVDNTGEKRTDEGVVASIREANFGRHNPAGALIPVITLDNGNSYRLDAATFEEA